MSDKRLLPAQNLRHSIITLQQSDEKTSLMTLAERSFLTQVAGQAEGTTDAKQRDLACFLHFYMQLYGHDDARQWYKSVTEAFLKKPRPRQGAQVVNRRVHYRNVAADDAHLPPHQQLEVSPHVLRHTLLRKVANEKEVHYAMELSGHRSDRYIWRYVNPDEQSLAEAIDELD